MKLTEKEKRFLSLVHESRFVDGKLLKSYEKIVKKHCSFSYKELHLAIAKFLNKGLLEAIALGNNEILYMHTDKVAKDMVDEALLKICHHP